jgi:hypothetical protein
MVIWILVKHQITPLTASKPHRVSPNSNTLSDHTLDPIMTVGLGLLEGLSWEGLPRSARGWFYNLIGWTVGRSAKSQVLHPDWLQLFFLESCRWIGTVVRLGSCCVRSWLNWSKIKGQKKQIAASSAYHACQLSAHSLACMHAYACSTKPLRVIASHHGN